MLRLNTDPTARQLRQFGGISVIALPLLVWLWGGRGDVVRIAAVAGGLLGVVGYLRPRWLAPLFIGLSVVVFPLGLLLTELILLSMFFLVFTPLALVFRLVGRDTMKRRFDPTASTYLVMRSRSQDPTRYYRQF